MKKEDFVVFYRQLSETKRAQARALMIQKGIDFWSFPIVSRAKDLLHLSLSFSQQRLWFLDQLEPGGASYNVPAAVRLTGQLDLAALEGALNEIVRRHEALRTSFASVDGTPVQVIAPELRLTLESRDLSDLPQAEREAKARSLFHAEAQMPFDLAAGPLIRARLLRLSDTEHIVLLTMHHIVSDGWSIGVLVREVAALYGAYVQRQPSPLPELPIQYADFAHWQRQWLSGEVLQRQLDYWQGHLAGAPALLTLPTDHPRPAHQSHRGATQQFTLSAATTAALNALSRQTQSTLFMTLTAAFNILLSRYAGQDDICIGTPIANRSRSETEGLIGFFVNTLVLRTQVDSGANFLQLLELVRRNTLDAYAHQDVPFEQLVEVLKPERHTSYTPLFQVMLVLQNTPMGALTLPGLTLQGLEAEGVQAKFDLTLTFTEGAEHLNGNISYNTDLFEPSTMARMAAHFTRLVEAIVADPQRRIQDLDMLGDAERRQLLVEWNDTASGVAPSGTIHALFEQRAAASPESVALEYEDASLTYGELNARANRLAHHLRTLGVGPDVLVGLCVERSLEMIVGLLAILKAGGAYVPLDPAYPADRLAYMLEDAAPAVLLTQQRLLPALPASDVPVFLLDADAASLDACDATNPSSETQAGNLAYVIYTSGSTGRPKGSLLQHENVLRLFSMTDEWFGFNAEDVWTLFHSYAFDFSVWEIWGALLYGGRLVIVPYLVSRSPDQFHGLLVRAGVTVLNQTPSAFQQLVEADRHQAGASALRLRHVIFGGEALNRAALAPWFDKHGYEAPALTNMYGITETTVHVTRQLLQQDGTASNSVGRPIPDLASYILDAGLNPVPVGVAGELHIAGAGLARGYLNRGDLTADRFIPNPFGAAGSRLYKSGDLARYLEDGSIEYLGRIDHQVKLRGFRIELGEIEAALASLEPVREALVLAREDVAGDKRLVAYLVAHDGAQLPDAAGLRAALLESLPEYMVPAHFVVLEQMPLTSNGKVDRKALPVPELARSEDGYVAPRTAAEEIMAGIWAGVLKLDKVGLHDDFFALGGHSLLATQLVSQIRSAFEVELPLRAVFEAPTIAGLMPQLDAVLGGLLAAPMVPVGRDAAMPLSFAQQRLWFLDQFEPGSAFYNIPAAVRLNGQLDVMALQGALNEIVRRHEALRTSFASVDGTPVQVIAPELQLALETTDLSDLPHAEREAKAQWLVQDEAHTPFDLSTGPLIRARLLRMSDSEHIVLLTMHHIVSDGWSIGVLVQEVAALYGAYVQQQPSPLPELPIQYADFAHWQRQWLSGQVLQQQLDYWQGYLTGAPALLTLPTDHPRPVHQTHRGATQPLTLSATTTAALNALSRQKQSTLFMTLTAAFNVLLSRYAGQDDICIGTPIANRNRAETEGLIGFFVNTLVLRTQVDHGASFLQLLDQVRANTLDAYAHQDVPFEQLVEVLKPERHTSHSPLFQVMLALQNAPMDALTLPGLTLQAMNDESAQAKFDLTFTFTEEAGCLNGSISYNTDLFEPSTMARMAAHFTRLVEAIVANPERRIQDLDMLDDAERHQLLVEWNDTTTAGVPAGTIHSLFEQRAAASPDAVALEYDNVSLTYGELNARANRVAHHLRTLGVGQDVLVGLCVERSLEMVIGLLAVLKAGGAYVPLDPAYPADRLAYMLEDAAPVVLLTQQRLLASLPASEVPVFLLDADAASLDGCDATNPSSVASAGNLAYVIYTSGSTGRPKGVTIAHGSALNLLDGLVKTAYAQFGDLAGVRVGQNASLSFDASVQQWLLLTQGVTLCPIPDQVRSDGEQLAQTIKQLRLDAFDCTPSQLGLLLQAAGADALPSCLLVGGEAIPQQLWEQLKQAPAKRSFNVYGPTEATVDTTVCAIADAGEVPVLGRPIGNAQVYLLDAALNPVPVGVAGELHIAGAGLARGYLNRADLTADKFVPNPFGAAGSRMYKSGDLARYLEDGNIEYLGRIDHQVKLRGFRIELGEIEAVLAALEPVRDALVLAREDVAGDKRLVAYLVAHDGEQLPDAAGLRAALLASLPEYMVPAHFVVLDQLPLTPNGKVDRKALPAPDMARSEEGYVAPRTAAEEAMADIWAGVLNLDKVGVHDNFFTLGGHSLLAITLVERMRRAGLNVDVRTLFATPTIAALAGTSGGENNDIVVPANGIVDGSTAITPEMVTLVKLDEQEIARVVAAVPGGAANIQDIYPLAPLQEGILFHHMMSEEGDAYLLPSLMQFDSRERLDGFVAALNKVVARHDILRTAMHWDGLNEAVQVVWREAHLVAEQVNLDHAADVAKDLAERYHPRHYRLDVRQAPLMRAFAAQDKANGRWLLQILAHHLAIDHSTLDMLVAEVRMLLQGRADELPPALPFRNFVAQARLGVSQAEHEAYFGAMLADVDEPTAPFGLLDVQGDGTGIVESHRMVDGDLSRRLRQQARQLGVSAASVMHLAWAQVLSKVSGRDDVVFGTVLLGRMAGGEDASSVLGMFINTLPVRFKLGEQGVAQAVRSAHDMLTQLLRHEHASLALAQRCSGVKAPMPLFSALLNYRHSVAQKAGDAAWQGVGMLSSEERTNYPVTFSVDDLGDDFSLTAQVSASVSAQRVCEYMHAAVEQLVAALEAAPDSAVGSIDVLPASERHQLLVEWNDTADASLLDGTLHELFERQVLAAPHQVALVYEDEQLTYAELNARANRLAHHLRTLGVGPDVLVGVCTERSLEMVVGLMGVLKAGGAYVPLDPSYPADRLAYMLEDAAPAVLLTQQRLLSVLPASEAPVFLLDADAASLDACDATNPSNLTSARNLAYVIYTSGSTGRPKGAAIDHAGIVNRLRWMQQAYELTPQDRVLQKTPFSFDVSVWEFFWPLMEGARLVLAKPGGHQDVAYLSQLIAQQGITTAHFVPPMLEVFANAAPVEQGATLRQVMCSGQALPWELQQRFLDQWRHVALHNLYGPTEASVDVTYWRCDAESELSCVPIGHPIANTQIHILDAGLNPVPMGVAGELHIAGVGLARGYVKRADLTADKFVPNPFGEAGSRMYKSGRFLARYLEDGSIE
ncbi:non-ribosomal peptide synthetase, partial [Duganella sp. HH101]|uniref:non-ribosomal peptide synthetase n=1 Tax=Duganella sp. HH101 TaxID=1781066 RepID=UPI000AECF6B1